MNDRFWMWFALINMAMCIIYMVAMFCMQRQALNEVLRNMEQLEAMVKDDITRTLIYDQADILERCLDFTLTTGTSGR